MTPRVVPAIPPVLRPRPRELWYAAVFPGLDAAPSSPMLQRLSLAALRFTSRVSLEPPDALLLDIKGSVKLFGSSQRLHEDLDAAWRGLGLEVRSATAPTTLAALWCARAGERVHIDEAAELAGSLAELPLACTAWDAEWLQTLRSMGVTRLGHLLRLPRDGVARRLKPSVVQDLDVLLGRQTAPRRAFVPCERFRERCEFEMEIDTTLYLQKALEPLIERCAGFLRRRQAGVQTLELRLRHRSLPPTRVRLGLASVTGERRRLADVLAQKLDRLELPAPVRSMELLSGALQALSADSLDAFAGLRGGGRDTAPQLVERLRARLGDEAVYGVRTFAEHRPEAAWQRVSEFPFTAGVTLGGGPVAVVRAGRAAVPRGVSAAARDAVPGGVSNAAGGVVPPEVPLGVSAAAPRTLPVPDQHMTRPVWLLETPVPVPAPGWPAPGWPAPESLPGSGDLILEEGPERIESGWWDGRGIQRDYYVARARHGGRWWIFQERRTRRWFLHGVFA